MRIKRISLKNYRKFDKLEITFDQQMTVIAALNSSGKTIVLDAVLACLWAFVRRIDAASGSKSVGIHIDDVTLLGRDSQVEAQLPSVIAAETFDDLSWEISREKVTPKTNTRYVKAKSIEKLAKQLQASIRDQQTSSDTILPVVAFYGTGRLWNQKQFTKSRSKLDDSFFSIIHGYLDCLGEASSYKYFAQWFQCKVE